MNEIFLIMRIILIILFCTFWLNVFGQEEGNGCNITEDTVCIYHENGNKKRCVINYQSPVNHWHRIEYYDEKGRLLSEIETGMPPDEYELENLDSTFRPMYFYNDSDLLTKYAYQNGNDTFETQYFYTASKKKYKEILFINGKKLSVTYSMYDLEDNFRARVSDDLKGSKYIEYFNVKQQPDSTISIENDKLKEKTIYSYKGNKSTQITRNNKNEIIVWIETEILKDSYIRITKNALGWVLYKTITYSNNEELSFSYNYDADGKLLGWHEYKGFCNGLRTYYHVLKNAKGKIIERFE